jgi:hypothetical protein
MRCKFRRMNSVKITISIILIFQIFIYIPAQAQVPLSPIKFNHLENKDVVHAMFTDEDFNKIINILGSPEFFGSALPWLVIGSTKSILIAVLISWAERKLEQNMFMLTFKEYAILQNPKLIDEYLSSKGLLHFHTPLPGVDQILIHTNYRILNGGSMIEIRHGNQTIELSRSHFTRLIQEITDIPLKKTTCIYGSTCDLRS